MAKKLTPKVSLVITVLNEQETIADLLSAIRQQTFLPRETIIVDGGSIDGTKKTISAHLKKVPGLRFFELPGANRSQGRNFGVFRSRYPIIAFTDAGCIPRPDWLEHLTAPFTDPQVQVVSGYYQGRYNNIFEKCLIPYVLVMPDRAGKVEFFPATRSMALIRSAWDKSGGFDPKLSLNEDYAFSHWLKKIGYNFYFAPQAIVEWFPRKNLWEATKMFFSFSLGDIQAGIIRPNIKALFIRYLVFIYLILLTLENGFFIYLVIPLAIVYIFWAIIKNFRYVEHPAGFFWLPTIQITADLSVMWGTLIGFLSKVYGIF